MEEELQMYLDDANERMSSAVDHLEKELVKIRAGKAQPSMLDSIMVEYYGSLTPLARVANVGTSDARTITIQAWEKPLIPIIEKAIMKANLGFNPENNGDVIRINVPPLTQDRRLQLVKQVKQEGETAKISIRNARKDTNEEIKNLKKNGLAEDAAKTAEDKVQKMTDAYILKVDAHLEKKEKDIMTV